jgi:hypothetical protein
LSLLLSASYKVAFFPPERSLEGEVTGFVAKRISRVSSSDRPQPIRLAEGIVRAPKLPEDPPRVAEMRKGEGSKLVEPGGLGGFALGKEAGECDGELGELDRPRNIGQRCKLALSAQELRQSPAAELAGVAKETLLLFKREASELTEESGCFGAGAREVDVERAEVEIKNAGAVKIEDVSACGVAFGAHREQVEQEAALGLAPILVEELTEHLRCQVMVFHANIPPKVVERLKFCSMRVGAGGLRVRANGGRKPLPEGGRPLD